MKSRLPREYQNSGAGNVNQMVKKAQKMQEDITRIQDEIAEKEFTKQAGGGSIELVMTGDKKLKSVTLKPEVVNPEDIEFLQDLIKDAVNDVIQEIDDYGNAEMEKVTGGVSMPGLF